MCKRGRAVLTGSSLSNSSTNGGDASRIGNIA
nr:MAG TPA: hypothetical protein [Caudoviricetes sp.]